ncbi:transmembrane 9 superfamily member 5-like isoform X2 [Amaranthus tricolor]|uniref:transmembrane 9 superfamily member 5-like isoform X2 n=1 Tax=Amaranthus tricolor TaxID=29722 RepID=UPI00258B75D1|nr:transmembrane 9 superfamily member 5-like isoform X2 [Amaranthus tricolor]XP_057547975.1 transmembrane 9 superfamily member 5-like isoform X2 [Amaranthus tricolor]
MIACEIYEYFDLPFCRPDPMVRRKESLGEVLSGDRLTNSRYEMKFQEMKVVEILCAKTLNKEEVVKFRDAIQRDFYFQMYYDDLPLWGYIGKVEKASLSLDVKGPRFYLFTHVQFDVLYNGNHVIEVLAFSDPNHVVDITEDAEIDVKFTYSAKWNKTSIPFANRMRRYSKASFLPPIQQLHWFSIINSVVIILLSMGLLAMLYWWNIQSDLKKYFNGDEDDREIGWACIDGDVNRCPKLLPLFCAVLGCGTQLLLMVCCLFVLTSLGLLEPYTHGTLWTASVVIYTITSAVAGYTAASYHCQFSETGWERSVLMAGLLFIGPSVLVLFVVNTVAVSYGSTAAVPLGTIVVMLLIHIFITTPLLVLGGTVGCYYSSRHFVPSTKRYVRKILPLIWYMKIEIQMFLGGLLPFSAVLVELHLFYASTWSYKLFTQPSILFINFSMLVCLTVILSVGLTYIQLSMEDPEWWWRSILRGGSTAIFMFVYCIYFYARSNLSGLMQLCYFLGYNACIFYACFLMLGAIAFRSSSMFVYYMCHGVKSE